MAILSIQSQLVAGHVGNSAAVFALQRLGMEVWPIPTVLLSHHPGHGGAQGGPVSVALLNSLLDGLASRGCFGHCEAVLSGYLGHSAAAGVVSDAVARAKTGTSGAIYLCDPVLGDHGRLYVSADVLKEMRKLAAEADIITPNAFELGVLSGIVCATRDDAVRAMRAVAGKRPKIVVLTSFAGTDTPSGFLDVMAMDGAAVWRLSVPDLAQTRSTDKFDGAPSDAFRAAFHGAGDVFAAIFLGFWLACRDTGAALGKACSALQALLEQTAANKADELLLIRAQDLFAAPRQLLVPERIS